MQTDRWVIIAATRPDDWASLIERHGGGVFHSPAGLWSAVPDGVPFFAQLVRGTETAGIALGLRYQCGLSTRARHAYLPTLPAIDADAPRDSALDALTRALALQGIAEVVADSFDARWSVAGGSDGVLGPARQEYVVHLGAACTPEELAGRCTPHLRRHLRRGEREGWTMRTLAGDEAHLALAEVQRYAANRASNHGNGFAPHTARLSPEWFGVELGAPWGMRSFAAFRDATLLAAALIGWAGGRAFYLVGGSTPDGYRESAAGWLHWRIMSELAEHGFSAYNLGGTPASAARADDPSHGLFRFKTGFGAEVVACRGRRWVFSSTHLRAHRLARRLMAPFHG